MAGYLSRCTINIVTVYLVLRTRYDTIFYHVVSLLFVADFQQPQRSLELPSRVALLVYCVPEGVCFAFCVVPASSCIYLQAKCGFSDFVKKTSAR